MDALPRGFEHFEPCDLRGVGQAALVAAHGAERAQEILAHADGERRRMRQEMLTSFPAEIELAGDLQRVRGRMVTGEIL